LHIGDIIVGGMMAVSGLFAIIATWNHPEHIRGLTYKQFMWCVGIATVGGLGLALWQFILPR
jgi:hypothetical protein